MHGRTGLRVGLLMAGLPIATLGAADWPQWGGGAGCNMVSSETGLPSSFDLRKARPDAREPVENVRWVVRLASYTYGNPTVAGGRVFVGTDARGLDRGRGFTWSRGGVVHCFDESSGRRLWQLAIPERTQLPERAHFGHQHLGVCSSPAVEGDRAWVVTSAADVVCLDVKGQADGNDGPFLDEGIYMAGSGRKPIPLTEADADILWRFDPIDELSVVPHDAASCSPLVHGDVVYVGTSNGVDAPHTSVVSPLAPSLIALHAETGRLLAVDEEKIGTRLYHAQWSSPALGTAGDRTLVLFGGGDGVCYAFEALDSIPEETVPLRKAWSYDCNPPEYKLRDGKPIPYYEGDKRKKYSTNRNDGKFVGPSQIISTPVTHEGRVYVAIGQDPAHGRGRGMLHCIDASGSGDITKTGAIWTYDGLDRSLSTVAVAGGLVYVGDIAGKIHCVDAGTGRPVWVHETGKEIWGGALVADGKLYFGNKERVFVMAAGRTEKLLFECRLGHPAYSTPVAAGGALYIASNRYLWAVGK